MRYSTYKLNDVVGELSEKSHDVRRLSVVCRVCPDETDEMDRSGDQLLQLRVFNTLHILEVTPD